jgi:hypothetical protein
MVNGGYWDSEHVAGASRLIYDNPQSHLKLELLKLGDEVVGFVYTDQGLFASGEVIVTIDGEEVRESILLRKGGMRARLGGELTGKLINALKNQKEVVIVMSGFKEHVSPDSFEVAFGQFSSGDSWLNQSIRGPLE